MKAEQRNSEIFRRRVREMLIAGMSTAAIAKATGKTYTHTARIVEQERDYCIAKAARGETK